RRSLVCVGLDPDRARLPEPLRALPVEEAIVAFNTGLIAATADIACAYKPNLGFYFAHGPAGIRALERTRALIPSAIPAILDAKIADIGSTATAYASGVFDALGFDAVTLNPYLGEDSLEPFLSRPGKGLFILCNTSNPGSGDLQDLDLGGRPLHLTVAERIAHWNARYPATAGLVVGATWPEQLAAVRAICPNQPILLPGIGAQAGDLGAALRAGLDAHGEGLVVTSSRAIIYASSGQDWAEAARAAAVTLRDQIEDQRRAISAGT
ncbi:MAG: orotidine-5'-phosphate decarboxylase, partial [Thermomicrobiales bacterium]